MGDSRGGRNREAAGDPGAPIVPAREQLVYLLLEQHHPGLAQKKFDAELTSSLGRRGALQGAAQAAELRSQE